VPNHFRLVCLLVNNLLVDFFGFILPEKVSFNIAHKLLFFPLINLWLMLGVDDLTVLPPSDCLQLAGLEQRLFPLLAGL